tara:strand:+ start:4415 stop:5812 length:1398 start_codon:yes stop_codon:yes gene_type:complete
MASVMISDLEAILKEFYLGPIIEALNNQLEMVELFRKITVDWSGKKVIIPVHVSRNTGTGFRQERTTIPAAGGQGHVDLTVTAKYLYGRFSLTGPAIASAKTTANSFATYVQTEMDGLVTDVKIRANQTMWTGAGCVGFVHDRIDLAAGVAPAAAIAFTGNKEVGLALQNLDSAPGVTSRCSINIVRLDDYSNANALGVMMADFSTLTPGVLEIEPVAAGTLTMSTIAGEYAAMIQVLGTGKRGGGGGARTYTPDAVIPAGLLLPAAENAVASEAHGVYANLGLQNHFGNDRNTGSNAPLRSTVQAINAAAGATNDALDFGRMQGILDEIQILGGDNPDCLYVHPIFRQEYAGLLSFTAAAVTTFSKDAQGSAGTAEAGYSAYAFAGIPVKVSRHCGKGIVVYLRTNTWSIAELQSFGMADLDGNVLSRLSDRDEWEGFVRWYYDLVCKEPNRNAILCGIKFSGM